MTLASKSEEAIESFITELLKHFKLHDLDPTTQLLGIKGDIDHPHHSLSLSQQRYTSKFSRNLAWRTVNPPQPLWSWV